MKLYATITSERATKGQGGNKYLNIEIKAQELEGIPTRQNLFRLTLANDNSKLYAELLDYSNHNVIMLYPKAKKQKGDFDSLIKEGICPTCKHIN